MTEPAGTVVVGTAPVSDRLGATPGGLAGPRQVRPEIQALRAVAVLSVVLFHFWPLRLPGGYVGVDVFFVISGYLITSQLLREVERTGRVRLAEFWARRARRLLPAALLVLAVSAITLFALVPLALWRQFLGEILSSALYAENWTLAANAVDYFASSNAASLSQHYWSLAVEEQFYLVWPLLLVSAGYLATRLRASARRLFGLAVLVTLTLSLALSIMVTPGSPTAYFLTQTRAWEFGVGALVALAGTRLVPSAAPGWRIAASLCGMAAIGVAVFAFGPRTPFPGYAALLPVSGAALVIWAGTVRGGLSPLRLYQLRPVQAIGELSYSLYLWHWPLLVAASYAVAGPPGTVSLDTGRLTVGEKVGLLVAAIVLAWLTKRFIEDPVRSPHSRAGLLARGRPQWSLLAALAASLAVVAVVLSGVTALDARNANAQASIAAAAATGACVGAAVLDPSRSCDNSHPTELIAPDPGSMSLDRGPGFACNAPSGAPLSVCHFGSKSPTALSLALVGDSHAAAMMPALLDQLPSLGWHLDTYLGSGCVWGNSEGAHACDNRADLQQTLEQTPYDVVLVTASRYAEGAGHRGRSASAADPRVAGYREAWQPIIARGTKLIVIADNPSPPQSAVECLGSSTRASEAKPCAISRQTAFRLSDAPARAAAQLSGAQVIDLSSFYCTESECPMVVGNVAVYYDTTHLTATYDRTLGPYLGYALRRAIGGR